MVTFIQHHVRAIFFITLGLLLMGLYSVANMPVSIFPPLTIPRIMIAAEGGDAPAQTILVSATRPLEQALSTTPGLEMLQSQTTRGSASLTLTFQWGTDIQQTLQLVNAHISEVRASLPAGMNVTAERLNPTIFPILDYSITSKTRSLADLRNLAIYTLRPRLARLPGVARVMINGGQVKEFQVTIQPDRLAAHGLAASQVEDALSKANTITAVGNFDNHYLRHLVLVNGQLDGADAIKQVVVDVKDRVPVSVGDVANVEESLQRQTVIATGTGQQAVLLNIVRQPTGNTIQVADEVKKELLAAKSVLPSDVQMKSFYDQSEIVQESENSVVESIVVGGVLALILLIVFLGNGRAAFTALILLPLTMVITFGVMKALGLDLNIMTLGALAIALGLVIDDSIVVVEHIYHHLEGGLLRQDAISQAVREITPAMIASSAASIVTFLPLIFLPGVVGNFFSALAVTVIATLAVSLILALVVCPTIALRVLPKFLPAKKLRRNAAADEPAVDSASDLPLPIKTPPDPPLLRGGRGGSSDVGISSDDLKLGDEPRGGHPPERNGREAAIDRHTAADHGTGRRGIYDRLSRWCLAHRYWVLLALIPLAFGSYFISQRLQSGFMPEFDEGAFVIDYKMPAGTSLAETDRVLRQVEGVLAHEEGVESWSRLSGALSGSGLEITPQNQGDVVVRLKSGKRPAVDDITGDVRKKVEALAPNIQLDFAQILGDLIGDLSGNPSPIEIKIYGPDMKALGSLADEVTKRLKKVKGLVDLEDNIVEGGPEAQVRVDPVRAAEVGLSTETITGAARAALEGDEVGSVLKGEIQEPIRIKYPGPAEPQMDPAALAALPLLTPTGQPVPLSSVATVTVSSGNPNLNRENQRLVVSVVGRLEKIDLGSAVQQVKAKLSNLPMPAGCSIEYGGLYKSQQQSFHDLGIVLLLAILFVVSVLIVTFRSFRVAVSLLLAAVLSLSGVLLALFITSTPLNISSFTGAIMIVGIVTENGVLLFFELQRLQRLEPHKATEDLLHAAGKARLRPILMTTFAAILTLLPLSLGLGAGAAMQKPLAIAVIGGLTLSMLFTLVVAPVIYLVMSGFVKKPAA